MNREHVSPRDLLDSLQKREALKAGFKYAATELASKVIALGLGLAVPMFTCSAFKETHAVKKVIEVMNVNTARLAAAEPGFTHALGIAAVGAAVVVVGLAAYDFVRDVGIGSRASFDQKVKARNNFSASHYKM
ncbi:MAG: hypothetical protein PHX43_09450 [Alphaproteobacteria bacterium]|nr:hypothetical protein [Alphaproteobacteria bacterium]